MATLLVKKADELAEIVALAHEIQDKAAREDRDLTDIERDRLTALGEARDKLVEECEFLNDQVTSERSYAALMSRIEANTADDSRRPAAGQTTGPPGGVDLHTRSWGDAFIESDAFRNYVGSGASARVALPFDIETRAALSLGTMPAQPPFVYTPAAYTLATPLLDVCGKVTTSSNAVSWVQWAPNPPSAATVVAEGELKPEATMTATAVSDTLDTYAHYKEITRQALEDIPQIRSIVEGRLRAGVLRALEGAVMTALGAATIPPVNGTAGTGGDTLLGLIRVGISTVQMNGYARANAILMNPADSADIDVAMLAGTMNGPVVNGSVWGVPIIPNPAVPAGTAYVGDFSVAVQLFTRAQTEVFMTDSHGDNFLRNIIAILAEQRALATVPDPAAAAKCVLAPAGP